MMRLKEHLKEELGSDLGVGGPGLARSLARLDLIDEYPLVLFPVTVGGGEPYFPALDHEQRLRLLETRTFDSRGGLPAIPANLTPDTARNPTVSVSASVSAEPSPGEAEPRRLGNPQ